MALFDYFSRDAALVRKRERCLKKLTNMYYQMHDRMDAAATAAQLARDGDVQSIGVLLRRFEHLAPNGTNDRDEKQYVHDLLLDLGEVATPHVADYVRRTDRPIWWPMKVLGGLWSRERMETFVHELLSSMDNDYHRYPDRKMGIVQLAAEYQGEEVGRALLPFVADQHEPVRFHAVDSLIRQGHSFGRPVLLARLDGSEDSPRIVQRIADAAIEGGWSLGEARDGMASKPPAGYVVTPEGRLAKRAAPAVGLSLRN